MRQYTPSSPRSNHDVLISQCSLWAIAPVNVIIKSRLIERCIHASVPYTMFLFPAQLGMIDRCGHWIEQTTGQQRNNMPVWDTDGIPVAIDCQNRCRISVLYLSSHYLPHYYPHRRGWNYLKAVLLLCIQPQVIWSILFDQLFSNRETKAIPIRHEQPHGHSASTHDQCYTHQTKWPPVIKTLSALLALLCNTKLVVMRDFQLWCFLFVFGLN